MERVGSKVSYRSPEGESAAAAKELHYNQLAAQISFRYFNSFRFYLLHVFGLTRICSSEDEFLQHFAGLLKELSRNFSFQVLIEPYFSLIAVESNTEAINNWTNYLREL
jgi:hypothetical protein